MVKEEDFDIYLEDLQKSCEEFSAEVDRVKKQKKVNVPVVDPKGGYGHKEIKTEVAAENRAGKSMIKDMLNLVHDEKYISNFEARLPITAQEYLYGADVNKKKEKENTMYHNAVVMTSANQLPTEEKQREYLLSRLSDIADDKEDKLAEDFFLNDDDAPRTATEMLERISKGLYVINTEAEKKHDKYYYGSPMQFISWRDPAKPADKDGHRKAMIAMDAAKVAATDTIVIGSPADGLAALKDFESKTFH